MGFFDETANKLGVPEGGGGLIHEEPGGLDQSIADAIQQIEAANPNAGSMVRADAPELGQGHAPMGQPPQQGQAPAPAPQGISPPPAPPAPDAPPAPPEPQTDPRLLEVLQRNNEVMARLTQNQDAVSDAVRQRQTEEQRINEMQSFGMDPANPDHVRQYFLHKKQEEQDRRLEEQLRFQQQFQQQARQITTQHQVEQAFRQQAPHLQDNQVRFYAQRAAQEAMQRNQPVEAVIREWSSALAPAPASAPQVPAQPQPAAMPQQGVYPQMDPATMMRMMAQMSGNSAPAAPASGTQDALAQAERFFFGGR